MKDRNLLAVTEVIDDETGNYRIGEIDYSITIGLLDNYFARYGNEGKKEIIQILAFLIYYVEDRFRGLKQGEKAGMQEIRE